MNKCRWTLALSLVISLCCVLIFCEYLIYYPAVLRCAWPQLNGVGETDTPLRALFLSDPHLLGAIKGHWLDKLRREWQMERAFQTAMSLLQPEIVFILGDIFDEGKWSSPEDWEEDVRRFQQIFRHPDSTELIGIVGNHDIGFHHEMSWFKLERFEKVFNFTSASVLSRKGVNFVLVNSMALHGDRCTMCQAVERQLYRLSQALNCSAQPSRRRHCQDSQRFPSSAAIILQHYPLYRVSDAGCRGEDAASPEERHQVFKERYDVLSQEASQKGSFSPSAFQLSKCFLPEESSVLGIYSGAALLVTVLLLLAYCPQMDALHLSTSTTALLGKHKAF